METMVTLKTHSHPIKRKVTPLLTGLFFSNFSGVASRLINHKFNLDEFSDEKGIRFLSNLRNVKYMLTL